MDKAKSVLEETMKMLNKKSANSVYILDDNAGIEINRFSAGRLSLDIPIGGGLPEGRIIEFIGWESSGKAQPLSSKVLTPNGWIKMGDIEEGQEINTPDGDTSTVIGIYPQGEQDVYEITFDDKTTVKCTLDHLWFVNSRKTKFGEVLSTKELLEIGLKKDNGCRKFKIPQIQPVKYNSNESLLINPYLLGILLGDGHIMKTSLRFSTIDDEIVNNVTKIIEKEYPLLKVSKKIGNCDYGITQKKSGHNNGLMDDLRTLELYEKYSYEKYIPNNYLLSSIEDRILLLQGLIDSDGAVGRKGSISYSTTSKKLSSNFEELCRSLGMRVTTSSRVTQYKKQDGSSVDGRESYRSNILFGEFKFEISRLTRKLERVNKETSSHSYRFIENIKKIGREECQCIMVGHPDHLYITDNFTPTHNTTAALHAIASYQDQGFKCAFIDYEHAFDPKYARALGVNTKTLIFSQPTTAEEGIDIIDGLVSTGEVKLITVDSVAAMTPLKELEGESGDSVMGLHARLMSQAMRKFVGKAHKTHTNIIFINQLREKIGVMFGDPRVTTGGNALKFFASVRVEFKQGKKNEAKGKNEGGLKVIKNKTYKPFETSEFDMEYGKGISESTDIINYAEAAGIIKKSGSWYSYGDTKLGQGKNGVAVTFEDNPELEEEITHLVMAAYFPTEEQAKILNEK